jgi:hypothetical protein
MDLVRREHALVGQAQAPRGRSRPSSTASAIASGCVTCRSSISRSTSRSGPSAIAAPRARARPTTTRQADWHDERGPNTKVRDAWLLLSLVNSTVAAAARKLSVTEEVVEGALDRRMSTEATWSE